LSPVELQPASTAIRPATINLLELNFITLLPGSLTHMLLQKFHCLFAER
jgi:hypothetical protein